MHKAYRGKVCHRLFGWMGLCVKREEASLTGGVHDWAWGQGEVTTNFRKYM